MISVKPLILTFLGVILWAGIASAQQQAPSIYLEPSEKCNNYARHFCLNGSHEASVNRALLDMKRKGYRITPKIIKNVARSTPSRLDNPAMGIPQQ